MPERPASRALLLAVLLPLSACTASRRAPPPPTPAPASPKPDHSAQIQLLYDQGVDAYAQGDMPRAKSLFESVLKLDPSHLPSQRALRRITLER